MKTETRSSPVTDFVCSLSMPAKLSLAREAACDRDLGVLRELESAGFFQIARIGKNGKKTIDKPDGTSALFNGHEHPEFAVLACVAQGAKPTLPKTDPRTGEKLDGSDAYMAYLFEARTRNGNKPKSSLLEFGEFLRKQAASFVEQYEGVPQGKRTRDEYHAAIRCYRATLGVLLGAAAAIDDDVLARGLCKKLAETGTSLKLFDNHWSFTDLAISEAIFKPDVVNVHAMHSAAGVAIEFSSHKVLGVLLDHGLLPQSEILMAQRPLSAPAHPTGTRTFEPDSNCEHMTLLRMLSEGEMFPLPSVMDKILPSFPKGSHADPKLIEWMSDLIEQDDAFPFDMLKVAIKHDVAQSDPNTIYCDAARRGCLEVLSGIEHLVKWGELAEDSHPVDAVLSSSIWDEHPDEMREATNHILQSLISHGRADLLGDGVDPEDPPEFMAPVELARKGLTAEVLLCLEHGADPDAQNAQGESIVATALDACHLEVCDVVRSFKSAKAARDAIQEMDAITKGVACP